jgi:hypothetical protein
MTISMLSLNFQNSSKTLTRSSLHVAPGASYRLSIKSYAGFRATGALPRQNLVSGLRFHSQKGSHCVQGRSRNVVYALFEKFTERSIKSVMLAQEWARNNSETEASKFELLTHFETTRRAILLPLFAS